MSIISPSVAAPPTDGLAGWAVELMHHLGGPGAAVVVGLDNVFPPVPSELVLPLAGFSAGRGSFSFAEALLWTTLGSVAGALVVYAVGALLGRDRSRTLVARLPLVSLHDVDRAEHWFRRRRDAAVLFGRMVPLVRSVVSLPAGIERMGIARFLGLTALGSLAWNALFVTAGYALGSNWYLVDRYAGVAQKLVLAVLVAALAWFLITRVRRRRAGAGPSA